MLHGKVLEKLIDAGVPFQWAPTLEGECYLRSRTGVRIQTREMRFNGHPPLGVNATEREPGVWQFDYGWHVSMGTHPWG